MSYDSDFESLYMVEFASGKTIHVSFYDVHEVLDYCKDEYSGEVVKTIYKEVYYNDEEENN